jgi:anthranilate synthase component 1
VTGTPLSAGFSILQGGVAVLSIFPSREEYLRLAETYNLIPVYSEWVADTETPISVFKRLEPPQPCFLLESVEGGENLGRYSFLGWNPLWTLHYKNGRGVFGDPAGGRKTVTGPPLEILAERLGEYRCPDLNLSRFFGGAVGYFAYDLVRYFEDLPSRAPDDLTLPDLEVMFPGTVLVFDHVQHTLKAIINTAVGERPEETYAGAVALIGRLRTQLAEAPPDYIPVRATATRPAGEPVRANTTPEAFRAAVRQAKEYIAAGEILQVVLSVRFDLPLEDAPFEIYRRLRSINPSPYLFYLDTGRIIAVGASPEMLVRVEDGAVRTRPIAGTRPRGRDAATDQALERELRSDAKEAAEHLMLVDLGRNDLARVCRAGSVQVPRFMEVERYSHVMHLTSEVAGVLAPGESPLSALRAAFPAGTVSGAPKVRAMEIIEELETNRRGVYAGAVGYIGLNGNLDTCIAIRTAVITGARVYVQAGAGIVADSDPEREYQEVLHKASALLRAVRGSEACF